MKLCENIPLQSKACAIPADNATVMCVYIFVHKLKLVPGMESMLNMNQYKCLKIVKQKRTIKHCQILNLLYYPGIPVGELQCLNGFYL